jgi:hypothetical protein
MTLRSRSLESLTRFDFLPPTSITATGAQTGLDISGIEGDLLMVLTHTAAGSGADLTFTIEHSDVVGSDYTAIPVTAGVAAFAPAGNAVGVQTRTIDADALKKFVRINCTAETGTATSVVNVLGFGVPKYQ